MGKSSLRVRTMQRLQAEGTACVSIQITERGTSVTPEQWYFGMTSDIVNNLNLHQHFDLNQWWTNNERLGYVRQFSFFIETVLLKSISQNIVIFIDESDSLLSLKFDIGDFFAVIRECYNNRADKPDYQRLTFVLIGVVTPSDLIQDERRTPFNIGRAIDLNGFELEEAGPLVLGLTAKTSNPQIALQAVLDWTGGQPFLTQKICNLIHDINITIQEGNEVKWIGQLIQKKVVKNWEAKDDPEHLKTIRNRILKNEQRAGRLLGLYEQILNLAEIVADDSYEQTELRLSGLVVQKEGKLNVYNRIYKEVFNQNWIDESLAKLRPYAQKLNAWFASNCQDESCLLLEQELYEARAWAAGKNLNNQDHQFLMISNDKEIAQDCVGEVFNALAIYREVQKWTSGQTVLKRKLCQLIRELPFSISKGNEKEEIANLVKTQLIKNWKKHDDLKELQASIQNNIDNRKPLLIYQQILQNGEIASNSAEQFELRKTGLVSEQQGKLKVSNPIYEAVFDLNFVKNELKVLQQDWGDAPDVSVFFGRTEELATLEKWIIHDRCRLIAILGMGGIGKTGLSMKLTKGGIGKTDLSLKLVHGIQDDFEYIIWRKLLNAPPITEILADIIKFLSNQQEIDLPNKVEEQVQRLLHYLKAYRCLLILDNFESILQGGKHAGQYQEDYNEYGYLLKLIGETNHKSCLVLTSREKPQEIAKLEGKSKPVRSLPLSGLTDIEGRKFFASVSDSFVASDNEWKELIEFYSGNPLVLELAAKHIDEVFFGNISKFLREKEQVFDDLKNLLNWHFERLSYFEKEVMYWLAINREPVSFSELKEDILLSSAKERLLSTLQSLQRRMPVEKREKSITLHPVLIEYITEKLIKQVCEEIKTKEIILFNNHALLKALAKDYIRETQNRFFLKPLWEQLITILGNTVSFKRHLEQILLEWRKKLSLQSGYLAGNILNLLCQLEKIEVKDYDFSYFTIQQAYLQGINLHNVNFSHSHMTKCVFTQTFGSILSVTFSPDGKLLATGDINNQIFLWQVDNGQHLFTFEGHLNWVRSVVFSPDGQKIASSSDDKTIKIWDIQRGICIKTLQSHTNWVRSIAFSPNNQRLASGSDDKTIKIWDVRTGQCLHTLHGHTNKVCSIAFSSNGDLLASGSGDNTVKIWKNSSGDCLNTLKGHTQWVWSVAFSPDHQRLASGSADSTIKIWDVYNGKQINTLQGHTKGVWSVDFSSDGQTIASGSEDQTIRIWDVFNSKCLNILKGHTNRVWAIAFNPTNYRLVSSSDDQTVRIWDIRDGKSLNTFQGYTNRIRTVAFNPNGKNLASGGDDRTVKIWDIHTKNFYTLQGHTNFVRSVAFSPNGQIIASSSDDQSVKIWDAHTGRCLRTLLGHTDSVQAVAFSPNSEVLASSSDIQGIKIWNIYTGECLKTLKKSIDKEDTNWMRTIAFSPYNKFIVSSSGNRNIGIWDVHSGKYIQTLEGHTDRVWSVTFSLINNHLIASGSGDKTVRIWDIVNGKCLKILSGHSHWIRTVAFSPNMQIIASGSGDCTIKIWNIHNGEYIKTLLGHTGWIRSIAFSPDGLTIASGSEDETIRLWNVKTGQCLKIFRDQRPYEGMNITGVTGLTEDQKATLKILGAVEGGE
jgi:WD40 repeat protein